MKKYIPNTITCLNLFSGCVATYFAFQGLYNVTLWFIILSAVFDFCDGLAARALKANSPIGKELDSLADMVSFGLVPGAMVFTFIGDYANRGWWIDGYLPFVGFLMTIFAALRLAKFNLDERQTSSFRGLPTPANTLFWGGLFYAYSNCLQHYPYLIAILALIMGLLQVIDIPLFSLKFHNLKWKENNIRFIFLGGCAILFIVFRLHTFAWIIVWYLILAISQNILAALSKKR